MGTVAVAGAGVLGLSTWAGLVLDELSKGWLVVRLAVVVVIAAGWLIPASYCVFALRGQSIWLSRLLSSLDIRVILPPIAIPGVLVMLHLLAFIPAMEERIPLLLWSCLATLGTWSLFYHLYRRGPLWAGVVHVSLDLVGVLLAIELIWPRIAGSAEAIATGSSSFDRFALVAVVLSGIVASVLMTSPLGTMRSVACRGGNWCGGLLLFMVVLISVQETWSDLETRNYVVLGVLALLAVVAWVFGLWDLHGPRWTVVSDDAAARDTGAAALRGAPARVTTAPGSAS